jgi:hypothetical protein
MRDFTLNDMNAGVFVTILVADGMAQNLIKETLIWQNPC